MFLFENVHYIFDTYVLLACYSSQNEQIVSSLSKSEFQLEMSAWKSVVLFQYHRYFENKALCYIANP